MNSNINGIIYYKLDAITNGYIGDITKNCGLKGEEIDGNFNFLRGHDIESISFDENDNLVIKRYDGSVLTTVKTEKPEYNFTYDTNFGILTIITPNGEEILLEGFYTEKQIHHDFTLDGTGLQNNPLKISNLAQTGRYFPAIKLVETLPSENVAKFDRYVTKEKISRFGELYNISTVNAFQQKLKENNSKWRVPTKEDWDSLLNFVDCENPEHGSSNDENYYGEFAGAALKSTHYWNAFNGKVLSDDIYGFSILPVGYVNDNYNSFGNRTAFWSSTEFENSGKYFVKCFDYNSEQVGLKLLDDKNYLSLRLVKDYKIDEISDTEVVEGTTIKCLHIPGHNLIWSKENVILTNMQGVTPEEWKDYENIDSEEDSYVVRFFINEWNGNSWDKQELKEGVGIVLYEGEYGRMHEWMVIDGVLTDVSEFIKPEFTNEINNINSKIDAEIERAVSVEESIVSHVNTLENDLTNTVNFINSKIDNINGEVNKLTTKIDETVNTLDNKFTNEIENVLSETSQIKEDVHLINANISTNLQSAIDYTNKEIESLENRLVENVESLENKLVENIGLVENKLVENVESIKTELTQNINSIQDNLINELQNTNTNISSLEAQTIADKNEINQKINSTNNTLNDFKVFINEKFDSLDKNLVNDFATLDSRISNLESNIINVFDELNKLSAKILNIETTLNSFDVLSHRVDDLDKLSSENKENIKTLDNKLDAKIISVDTKFDNKLDNINTKMTDAVKDIEQIKAKAIYKLIGTPNEIIIGTTNEDNTVTVGFASDAIFVAG